VGREESKIGRRLAEVSDDDDEEEGNYYAKAYNSTPTYRRAPKPSRDCCDNCIVM
jgi:hypothetical protein